MINMNSPLLTALKSDGLSAEKKALLRQLDAYDFRHVAAKTAEEYPELNAEMLLTNGVPELRRYYAMRIIYGDAFPIGVPIPLDPLVHIHNLYTKEYRKFCAYFFEGMFEHWPCDRSDQEHMRWLGVTYKETLKRMDNTFVDRNQDWWPDLIGANVDVCCGCSCAGV